ncbi:MAG: Fe(3+) ions import ATP-binding protein FbpC 1 [Actinomycetia bacterium]|nr:Fe(3+) ions import ATP-binding protein FbpC 1 [Actinomycetes bacterium]
MSNHASATGPTEVTDPAEVTAPASEEVPVNEAERAVPASAGQPPVIEIAGLRKSYGATEVLRGVDLSVARGSITAVLGASGSGKTTLLRLIAGFDEADAGTISIAGRRVDDGRRTVSAQHRGVGYVPQDSALFPHLTVRANVAFGMPRRSRARLPELLALVGLTGYEKRYPHQLSGGQQQRVALARALATEPKVVLMDEPFGALDAALRDTVRSDVARILADSGTTVILVTHDQDEALSLADHVAFLDAGTVTAHGTPRELYDRPPTPQVAAAIGIANILDGEIVGDRVRCAFGELPAPGAARAPGEPAGAQQDRVRPCQVLLRPESLHLRSTPDDDASPATVRQVRYHGHDTLIDLVVDASGDADGLALTARITGRAAPQPGQRVWIATTEAPHVWT